MNKLKKNKIKKVSKALVKASKLHAGQAKVLKKIIKKRVMATAAWTRKEGKSKSGGLNKKGEHLIEKTTLDLNLKQPLQLNPQN